jgi:hypothetical protein
LTFLPGVTKITSDGLFTEVSGENMRLPDRQGVIIPEAKIKGYLLSPSHPYGRHKATFFKHFGFNVESWELMASALREHAEHHDIARVDNTRFGTRYIVEGQLRTPDGRAPIVRVIWFVEKGDKHPRLVTAYPLEEVFHD